MSESQSPKRPRYFDGKLLTPEDFQLEQDYFIEKSKRHNRSLHGFGVVSGLKVAISSGHVVVQPGLALDCEGNELLIETARSIVPPPCSDGRITYLSVRFVEHCTDLVPTTGGEEASTITEGVEFAFVPDNSNRGHRHLRGRWLACGQLHALTIAKLRPGANGWRVDRGYRAPAIK